MKKVYVFLTDGFEEIEALSTVDLLRRAGAEVTIVSIVSDSTIRGAHDIKVCGDVFFGEADFSDGDAFVLPGGQPGTDNLNANEGVRRVIKNAYEEGKLVAAICAAPMVLGSIGILDGKKATCYPGCEGGMTGAKYTKKQCEKDGNIITANGPGSAFAFGLEIIEYLFGRETAKKVAKSAIYTKTLA